MSPLPKLSDVLLSTQTDERLARLAGDGDHWAFAALVQRHRVPLLRLAAGIVGRHRSEDVVQQGLLRAWMALAGGTEVRNFQAWLYTIVRNAAYSEQARGTEGASPIPDELADHASAKVAEHRLLVQELIAGIAGLPEHQRTALVETELEGRSRRQIAADMGLTEGAVRQLVHRARNTLRVAMTAITPYPLLAWLSRHSGGSRLGAGLSRVSDVEIAGRSAGLAEPAASGAAAGAALAVKGGVALLAAGAIGGLSWQSLTDHGSHRPRHAASAPLTADRRGESNGPGEGGLGLIIKPSSVAPGVARSGTLPLAAAGQLVSRSGGPARDERVGPSGSPGSDGLDSHRSGSSDGSSHQAPGGEDRAGATGSRSSGSDGERSGGDGSTGSPTRTASSGSDGGSVPSTSSVSTATPTTPTDGGSGSDQTAGTSTTPRVGDG